MPSLVVHLLIPPLVLLAARRFDARLVLGLLPFSLLSDVDFFLPPHRAWAHSVFLVTALGVLAWRARGPGLARWRAAALVAAFYLGSHSLLDLFVGGVVPLWPLSDQTFFVDVRVLIDTATLQPFPVFEPGTQAGVPQVSPVYEFLDGTQFGILVLTLLVAGAAAARRALVVRHEVVVVAPERPAR